MAAECRDMHIQLLPPDINRCDYEFVPVGADTILYGLGAIKGLGRSAIDAVLEARRPAARFRMYSTFAAGWIPGE